MLTVWDNRGFLMFFRWVEHFPFIRLTTDLAFVPYFEKRHFSSDLETAHSFVYCLKTDSAMGGDGSGISSYKRLPSTST